MSMVGCCRLNLVKKALYLSSLLFLLGFPLISNAYDLHDMWILSGVKGSADESWQAWCDNKSGDFTDLNLYNHCATFSPGITSEDAFSNWALNKTAIFLQSFASHLGMSPILHQLNQNTTFRLEFEPGVDDSRFRFVISY